MAANSSLTVASLDFDNIKADLKSFLQGQSLFQDYDFTGSNLNVLLDILAYNTYYNNFYLNMLASEMFLDTATLRDSLVSHAKELNYLPRSARGSSSEITLQIYPDDTPASITVPKHTAFITTVESNTYTFSTEEALVILPDASGNYLTTGLSIKEGEILTEYFTVTSNTTQRFVLSNQNIDTSTIEVKVRASNSSSTNSAYDLATSLYGLSGTSNVFFLQAAENDTYEVLFGNNITGRRPVSGNIVEATYHIVNQDEPNSANTFTPTGSIAGYSNVAVTTTSAASGGTGPETVEEIKFNAPRSVTVQERAVTKNDYKILLQQQFPEIAAISVFGGEDQTPPKFGKVIISVDLTNADGIPDVKKKEFKDFIDERTPVSIESEVIDPEFLYVDITSEVRYNINVTNATSSDVSTSVRTAISSFANTNVNDFEKTFRLSNLITTIDAAEDSIISNDTTARAYKIFTPTLNANNTLTFEFNNALDQSTPVIATTPVETHEPAVQSSTFTYQNVSSFLMDDGSGVLNIYSSTSGVFNLVDANFGTVDYASGTVTIRDLNISAFEGATVRIFVRTEENEIVGKLNNILQLNDGDVTLTITPVRV